MTDPNQGAQQESDSSMSLPMAPVPPVVQLSAPVIESKQFVRPTPGESITSLLTNNTYVMEEKIGEGSFGEVFGCHDVWENSLAAKVLKPLKHHDELLKATLSEFQKLLLLRHPNVTYIYDAFEYRNACYIITERCYQPISWLFEQDWFHGPSWLMPIARCLLQAVQFAHLNQIVHQDIHEGNFFATFARNEMTSDTESYTTQFKLGDLGVAKLFDEIDGSNTRAQWILPPEVLDPQEFGPMDSRIDIYHSGLLLLQLASSKLLRFTHDEIKAGKPREMAKQLDAPLNFALEKALRRYARFRTTSAMELWRDLNSSVQALESDVIAPAPPTSIVAPELSPGATPKNGQ